MENVSVSNQQPINEYDNETWCENDVTSYGIIKYGGLSKSLSPDYDEITPNDVLVI